MTMFSDIDAPFQVTTVTIKPEDVLAGIAGDPYESPLIKALIRDYGMRDLVLGVSHIMVTDENGWQVASLPADFDDSAPGEVTLVFTQDE